MSGPRRTGAFELLYRDRCRWIITTRLPPSLRCHQVVSSNPLNLFLHARRNRRQLRRSDDSSIPAQLSVVSVNRGANDKMDELPIQLNTDITQRHSIVVRHDSAPRTVFRDKDELLHARYRRWLILLCECDITIARFLVEATSLSFIFHRELYGLGLPVGDRYRTSNKAEDKMEGWMFLEKDRIDLEFGTQEVEIRLAKDGPVW